MKLGNVLALPKILCSLPGLAVYKKQIDQAKALGADDAEREAILKATQKWGNYLVDAFDVQLSVEGKENLPTEGPVVFVANHQGYADIPVLCSVIDCFQFGFLAKDALDSLPLYGTWMRRIRSIMIKRNDPRASLKAIAQCIELVKQGYSFVIFPEGTRAKGHVMHDFKAGALKVATKTGVPIVPISLNGTFNVYEKPGISTPGVEIGVIIHPPIATAGISRKEEKALNEQVENTVKEGVDLLCQRMGIQLEPYPIEETLPPPEAL